LLCAASALNPDCSWIEGGKSVASTYVESFFGLSSDKLDIRSFHFGDDIEYITVLSRTPLFISLFSFCSLL